MKLSLETEPDLAWALAHNDGVTSIRLSAQLARSLGVEGIDRVAERFPALRQLEVADDYLPDQDMKHLAGLIKTDHKSLSLNWTYDLKIDGKHGR